MKATKEGGERKQKLSPIVLVVIIILLLLLPKGSKGRGAGEDESGSPKRGGEGLPS